MNKVSISVVLLFGVVLAYATGVYSGWWSSDDDKDLDSVVEISWEDLIPADFVPPENPFDSMSQEEVDKLLDGSDESNAQLDIMQKAFEYAPTVPKLDGMRVKLPAYITPLDFDGQLQLSEFLLVPYMGACIHVPPPPGNQIVHAISETMITLNNPYDPVWAVGVLHVETVKSDLAEAGYRIDIETLLPYTF